MLGKTIRVINSCETSEQLTVGIRYATRAANSIPSYFNVLRSCFFDKVDVAIKCKLHELQREGLA